jgi:Bestrophin, RFP-TM, chloride channel
MEAKRELIRGRRLRRPQAGCILILSALLTENVNHGVDGFTLLPSARFQDSRQLFDSNSGKRRLRSGSSVSNELSYRISPEMGLPMSTSCTTNSDDPMNNRHSASDWLYNIKSFPQSKVLREIRNPVLAVASWSFVVSLVHTIGTSTTWAPPLLKYVATQMCIPGTAHSFLVSALGLLLVFRTNSAYQRFNVSVCSQDYETGFNLFQFFNSKNCLRLF